MSQASLLLEQWQQLPAASSKADSSPKANRNVDIALIRCQCQRHTGDNYIDATQWELQEPGIALRVVNLMVVWVVAFAVQEAAFAVWGPVLLA